MKRVAEEPDFAPKRVKRDYSGSSLEIFKDPTQEKTATDLINWNSQHDPDQALGYISGKIIMKWPMGNLPTKYRMQLELFSLEAGAKKFEVELAGPCADRLTSAGLQFKVGQELRLSLRGADVVVKTAFQMKPSVVLKYAGGAALEILPKGEEPGWTMDTWNRPAPHLVPSDDDWFSTPNDTSLPTLHITKGTLMKIDERPAHLAASPSPEKPVSRSSITIAPKTKVVQHVTIHADPPNPLNSIENSLSGPATPSQKSPTHASSSSSILSRPVSNTDVQSSRSLTKASGDKQNAPKEHPFVSHSKSPTIANQQDANVLDAVKVERAMATSSRTSPSEFKQTTTTQSGVPPQLDAPPLPEPGLNKKQKKNKARRANRKLKAGNSLAVPISTVSISTTTPTMDLPKAHTGSSHAAPGRTPTDPIFSTVSRDSTHIPDSRQPAPATSPSSDSCAIPAASQRRQIPRGYTRLTDLTGAKKWSTHSVIAVVTDIKIPSEPKKDPLPSQTSQSGLDLKCSLRVVDPSNCQESFPPAREGFLINCWTEKHKQWLPTAAVGSIVILRKIKITEYLGQPDATGYKDKLQWAVYDPSKGEIGHGDIGDAPRAERLGNGLGVLFSPFYEATDEDSAYCLELDDWWRGVQEKRLKEMGTVHQVGEGSSRGRPWREHSLICDVAMDAYFDCTVEVLHARPSLNGKTYTLFCTDYTVLSQSQPCHESWCPPSLADRIFSIEMWESARKEGPNMISGAFYSLKNVRMRTSNHGYAEGKLVEPKIRKLEPGDDNAFLKGLLRRKEDHGPVETESTSSDLKLIGQGRDRDYMSCVVELLHREQSTIYITDYTSNPEITPVDEPWARGLNGYVLKVVLFDAQISNAQHLVVGQYYAIEHLRLRFSVTAQEFIGTLGGPERLIRPINPKLSVVGDRRDQLLERRNKIRYPTDPSFEPTATLAPKVIDFPRPESLRPTHVSIQQMCSSTKSSGSFFVRARVVDFYPFQLEDSFVRTCTKCNRIIPDKRLACYQCDDVEHKFVKIVCVFRITIRDESDELQLSVSGNVPLLNGQEHINLRDDPDAARRFAERIKPLIGNLREVHDSVLLDRVLDPSGSEMTFVVDRWKGKNEEWIYGLQDYKS